MHFRRFWPPQWLSTSPGRRQIAHARSQSVPPNPQKRLRGAHISTLRRFQAPSCKVFEQTTYTNTSNIDFCRTYNAFSKVLAIPMALHFSRSMPNRNSSFALGTPEPSKTLKRGSHFDLVAFPGSILLAISANDLHKHVQHRFLQDLLCIFEGFGHPMCSPLLRVHANRRSSFAVGTPRTLKNA